MRKRWLMFKEAVAWRYDRLAWPLRHRWAYFMEQFPLMLLSTHTAHVKALDERLKRQERQMKSMREGREYWPEVIG
jgi:hypothetical protein